MKVLETGPFSLGGSEGGGALPLPGPRLGRIRIISASVSRIDTRYSPANRAVLGPGADDMYRVSIHDTLRAVLRPADLLVLLGLLKPALAPDWSVRSLAAD